MLPSRRRSRGFTLLEVTAVIVIVGILAAVAVVKVSSRSQQSATVQADAFRRVLSHVQMLALRQSARLRLTVVSGGGSYAVAYQACPATVCTAGDPVTDPATGQALSVTLTDGVTISPAGTLDFDSLGRPNSPTGLLATNSSFTVAGGGRNVTVTVRPVTGFATTTY